MRYILKFYCLFFSTAIFAQTYNGTTGNITDDGQVNDFNLTVSGLSPAAINTSHGLINVCLDISHTYDSDLNVHLVAPDGTEINLFSGIGGGDDDFTNTCLSQSSSTPIGTATAPFTGTFKPQETLGNMNNGQNGNGVWKLRIVDTYPADAGVLNSWSITFGAGASGPFVFTQSNLPIVIINTGGTPIPDEPKINGTMGIIYNGPGMMNHVTDPANNYNGNIGIEMRGAYSQSLPQKPYAIETRDASNLELDASLLGMPAEHDWSLIANYNDKVFVRNTLAYKLFNEMGHYSTRSQYCEVVVNGSYQGVYMLMESIKRDNNRVDIAKLDTMENTGIDLTGGYILKNDYWDASNSWLLNYHPIDHPTFNIHLVYDYPKPDNITIQQKNYIQTFVNDLETALYSTNYTDTANGYRKYMSITSFVDYLIVNELARNNDGFKKSSYFHKDKDKLTGISKLKAGPVWDFDWAWKNINECSIFAATDGSGWAHHINDCNPDVNSPGWYVRMMQDTSFQNTLRCRWEYFRTNILSENYLFNYIDSIALYLDSAQYRHFDKWGNLGVSTGTPEVDADPATFAGQVTKFKNWISLRLAWLDANIPGNAINCNITSINELENNEQLFVYPNPVKDVLYFSNKSTAVIDRIDILDVTGKLISSQELANGQSSMDISAFANGFYFCQFRSGNKILHQQKVVVMH
ncbi:MAG: CotH kinase family protein [Bacteroidia bacterium]|nr:CotH kinase family protein [Bacteroidia bacterium]